MDWGRFLFRGTHQRRLDGDSLSEWCRSRVAAERSGGRGGPQRGRSGVESRERRAVQRGDTRLLLDEDLETIMLQGARGPWRDRAATGDTDGVEHVVSSHDGVCVHAPTVTGARGHGGF
jgi:hypothetical protein